MHPHIRRAVLLTAMLTPLAAHAQRAATHSSNIWGVTFARDEASVATVARGEVRIWALPSGQLACRLDGSYYNARIATDGEAGYHITFVDYSNGDMRALRAVRINAATCAQTAVPVISGAMGRWDGARYVVRAPGGRVLHNGFATPVDSRVTVTRTGGSYTIAVAGGPSLESADLPSVVDVGSAVYTCTTRESGGEFTYHRIAGDGRPEKVGSAKPDRYGAGACGELSVSSDTTQLLDASGTVIDLRRKRVLANYAMSQPTSVGVDNAAGTMTVGHGSGAVVVDLKSGKPTGQTGGNSTAGYVSPRATWTAIASSLIARPLVELRSARFSGVVLDDARSRPAADILGAQREAETQARLERERREAAEREAERARQRAALDARAQVFMKQISADIGPVDHYRTLRWVDAFGRYEATDIALRRGDVLVLASEVDGTVTYRITAGERYAESSGGRQLTSGRAMTHTVVSEDIQGSLQVSAGRGLVFVFVVPREQVRR